MLFTRKTVHGFLLGLYMFSCMKAKGNDVAAVLSAYCALPFACCIEQDKIYRPRAYPVSRKFSATVQYFLGSLTSVLVDRMSSEITHDEFVANYVGQGIGWSIALGENLAHDRRRNFYMLPRSKMMALMIILASSNVSGLLRLAQRMHKDGMYRGLKDSISLKDLGCAFLRILPQSLYILMLPSKRSFA